MISCISKSTLGPLSCLHLHKVNGLEASARLVHALLRETHPVNRSVFRSANRATVLEAHRCAVDVAEFVFPQAVQLVLVEAATA